MLRVRKKRGEEGGRDKKGAKEKSMYGMGERDMEGGIKCGKGEKDMSKCEKGEKGG